MKERTVKQINSSKPESNTKTVTSTEGCQFNTRPLGEVELSCGGVSTDQ